MPAPPDLWTHDPFGGDVADGYVWGRGAVDMKGMVALELSVIRMLAAEARAAGRDPASDPIPGLTRDVLFASTADEEAGGVQGAGWVAANRPEWLRAAGALNEAGGVSMELAGRRFYPIQVAEKGFIRYRITVSGTWGHGSMPREDNAAVRAAEVVRRLAPLEAPRLTPVMERLFATASERLPAESARLLQRVRSPSEEESDAAIAALCEPSLGRATRALLRDTMSPNMIHVGVKFNVIPGTGEVEIDVRNLPGTPGAGDARPDPPPPRRGALGISDARGAARRATGRGADRHALYELLAGHPEGPRPGRRSRCRSWRRSRPTPSTPRPWACRRTASRRSGSTPTTGSWSCSTASTNGSASTGSASGCRSSTTWFGCSAGCRPEPLRRSGR